MDLLGQAKIRGIPFSIFQCANVRAFMALFSLNGKLAHIFRRTHEGTRNERALAPLARHPLLPRSHLHPGSR